MKPSVIIKNISYNELGDTMKKKTNIIDYAYERENIEDVQTYIVTKEKEFLYLIPHRHFYFSILGEKTIEKLVERGYLSMEELEKKYENNKIEKQIVKKKKRR